MQAAGKLKGSIAATQKEDPVAIGPVQILVVGFPSNDRFEGRIAEELFALSDAGTIRLIDALVVMREDGETIIARTSDLDEEQREELGAAVGALVGLGAAGIEGFIAGAELGADVAATGGLGIVEEIADEFIEGLPDDSSALLLIIEHRWAIAFAMPSSMRVVSCSPTAGSASRSSSGWGLRSLPRPSDGDERQQRELTCGGAPSVGRWRASQVGPVDRFETDVMSHPVVQMTGPG